MIYLTLGSVTFQDFEVPEKIRFGGQQRAAVHELIGGGRVIDVLGGQPTEIRFSGIFSGADAGARAQSIDTACAAGVVAPLGWDGFFYNVIIAEFVADYEKPFWIPFALTCLVTAGSVLALAEMSPAVGGLIAADLGVASQWAAMAGVGMSRFTTSNAAAEQTACKASLTASGQSLLAQKVILNDPATPAAAIAALNGAVQDAGAGAAAAYANGYLGRAVQNISLEAL